MTFAYDKLIKFRRELEQVYSRRDTILYALGVGAGIGAQESDSLHFVYEDKLQALPTMSTVLAAPGFWQREDQFRIDWKKILHGEQSVQMHKPLPIEGSVAATLAVDAIYDKGEGKGALLYTTRTLYDRQSGDLLATIRQGSFMRGNGGQGGVADGAPKPHAIPGERAPDHVVTLETRPEQALIYRLSGDYNPLHADPAVARAAGFSRPILHGLSTYGIVCRAVLQALCGNESRRLKRLDVRFASPLYPGETVTTDIWLEGDGKAGFRSHVADRDVVVINNGYAEYE